MGVVYMPEPKRQPQRPTASAADYPVGTVWQSPDGSYWKCEWDEQDHRKQWFKTKKPKQSNGSES